MKGVLKDASKGVLKDASKDVLIKKCFNQANFSKKVCAMDSLKFIFGILLFLLCMGVIGVLIWIMLFGIPQSAMDGGTLVWSLWNEGKIV